MMQNRKAPIQEPSAGYPMLTTAELGDCLLALGIQVHPEEISKPTAQSVQMIFARLMENIIGVSMELMDGPRTSIMGMMEYKELYADALQFTMFFQHCKALTDLCGVPSFHISDLTRPDANRVRTALSGIMNFAKFRESRTPFYLDLQNKVQLQLERTDKLREELHRIEASIEEITAKHAADRPKTEAARARNEELRSELFGLKQSQQAMSHEVEDLKQKRQVSVEQAAAKNQELAQLKSQISSTRSRLVQSPDRIKRHISDMSSQVAEEKVNLASQQKQTRDLVHRLEVINRLELDLSGLVKIAKGIEETKIKLEQERRIKKDHQTRLEARNIELENLVARSEQLNRQINNTIDNLNEQNRQTKQISDKSAMKMEELRNEYLTKKKERGVIHRQTEKLETERAALEQEITSFMHKHESELNTLLEEYWTVRKQAEDYMNTMTAKLGLTAHA